MAQNLHPWFREYLIDLLQNHTQDFNDAPVHGKKKKVQITKFLTYGSQSQSSGIWGEASDKQYLIPIKFTLDAVAEFKKTNPGQRLTQHKGAIAVIQNFKIITANVPLPGGGQTTQSSLAIECSSVSILGCSGEAPFGSPIQIGSIAEIRSWIKAPNRQDENIQKSSPRHHPYRSPSKSTRSSSSRAPAPSSKSVEEPLPVRIPLTRKGTHDLKSYTAIWHAVANNSQFEMRPSSSPASEKGKSTTVKNHGPIVQKEGKKEEGKRSRSASPISSWEQSPVALKRPRSHVGTPQASKTSSSQLLPTPSERRRTRAESRPPEDLLSYPMGNETVLESQPPTQARSKQNPMTRKIPRPASPEPPRGTGPVRILAPNSDTSGTQTQSQSQPYAVIKQRGRGGAILEAVNNQVEQGKMDEDYPWIDLWEMRAVMGRIMEARKKEMD